MTYSNRLFKTEIHAQTHFRIETNVVRQTKVEIEALFTEQWLQRKVKDSISHMTINAKKNKGKTFFWQRRRVRLLIFT